MSHEAIQRLKALEQLNSNRDWTNRDLYRLMYKEDLYVIAYERMKADGSDHTTPIQPGNLYRGG